MFSKKNNLEKKIKLNISSKDLESDYKKDSWRSNLPLT